MDPLEDEPTPVRHSSFAAAIAEGCLTQILRTMQRYAPPLPEEAERELRGHLDDLQALLARRSHTAIKAATEAEIDADNERIRREAAERQRDDALDDLAASRLREHTLAQELAELRREITK